MLPFDQLIWLPSGLSRPTTNCHSGAMIWPGACRCPYDLLPVSLVSVRNMPWPAAIEACFDGSPCAHQVPRNAATSCGPYGCVDCWAMAAQPTSDNRQPSVMAVHDATSQLRKTPRKLDMALSFAPVAGLPRPSPCTPRAAQLTPPEAYRLLACDDPHRAGPIPHSGYTRGNARCGCALKGLSNAGTVRYVDRAG